MASYLFQESKASIMAGHSSLSFIFNGDDVIVQYVADRNDPALLKHLQTAMQTYQSFNDGKPAALVRIKGSVQYWITTISFAQALDKNLYHIVATTIKPAAIKLVDKPVNHGKVTKVHIRRPRNQFILYRQWMSGRIHAENPGMTAASISQVVSHMWRSENPVVRAHFKALADEEDRKHKMLYPEYRYEAGRNPKPALRKRNLRHDPMTITERLIAAGY
ncbi:HMG box domain-containing protein [Madurella fahalii]|uniref:HMG box domain-containing protein n=1 Tax=Madurella fahalii TaxID=1157608 RepID=A0ABQ0G2M6_9PEZI